MEKSAVSFVIKLVIALAALAILLVISLWGGAADTSLRDVVDAVVGKDGGPYYDVLREIRFPRVIAAFFVGAALAVAGAIMQGMTRNALADPGLLGLTSGANLALAVALIFIPGTSFLMLMFSSFIGAAAGMLIVFGVGASSRRGLSPLKLILAGSAISLFLQSISSSLAILFHGAKDINAWTAGGLIGTSWSTLIIVPFIIIGLLLAIAYSKQLTILSLDEELAKGLGQKTRAVRIILLLVVVILAGTAVSLIGNLAFVGLFIPHIVRRMVGGDYRFVIPMSMIVGGIFMILTDFICRTVIAPLELPIVALVAIIGLPFFMFIVRKGGRTFFA